MASSLTILLTVATLAHQGSSLTLIDGDTRICEAYFKATKLSKLAYLAGQVWEDLVCVSGDPALYLVCKLYNGVITGERRQCPAGTLYYHGSNQMWEKTCVPADKCSHNNKCPDWLRADLQESPIPDDHAVTEKELESAEAVIISELTTALKTLKQQVIGELHDAVDIIDGGKMGYLPEVENPHDADEEDESADSDDVKEMKDYIVEKLKREVLLITDDIVKAIEAGEVNRPVTECVRQHLDAKRRSALGYVGVSGPSCDINGDFKPLQCAHAVCWCAYHDGTEIPFTRRDRFTSTLTNTECALRRTKVLERESTEIGSSVVVPVGITKRRCACKMALKASTSGSSSAYACDPHLQHNYLICQDDGTFESKPCPAGKAWNYMEKTCSEKMRKCRPISASCSV